MDNEGQLKYLSGKSGGSKISQVSIPKEAGPECKDPEGSEEKVCDLQPSTILVSEN